MKTVRLVIQGMHCEGCAHIVQNALQRIDGVQASTVSYRDGTAQVMFDSNLVNRDQLAGAVRKAGYEVAGDTT